MPPVSMLSLRRKKVCDTTATSQFVWGSPLLRIPVPNIMDFHKLILLTLVFGVELMSSHPQRHKDLTTASLVPPKPQHYNAPYEYGKAYQPDMQKWRYYQQQQVDAKNIARYKSQIYALQPKRLNVEIQRNGWIPKPELSNKGNKNENNREIDRKRDYKIKDHDLETQPTENFDQKSQFIPSPQITPGQTLYQQNNQDIAQLNSLLGQTPENQLQGLQKLLNSQSSYTQQNALPQPQQVGHLQNQLDVLSQGHVQQILQEAQQQALNQVKLQHDALVQMKVNAEKAALAKIQAHNSGTTDIGLHSSSNLIDEKLLEPVPVPQPLMSDKEHQVAIDQAVLQAQAYLQQSTQSNFLKPSLPKELKIIEIKTPQQPPFADYKNSYSYPQSEPSLNSNSIKTTLQAEIVKPTYSYNQNNVVLDTNSINPNANNIETSNDEDVKATEIIHREEAEDYNDDYADEYAPNYKFGYQIMDYHSGNDYGHEEVKEGKMTKGQYHILLPDGRTQNVEYWADASGYHAKVTYTNVAHH